MLAEAFRGSLPDRDRATIRLRILAPRSAVQPPDPHRQRRPLDLERKHNSRRGYTGGGKGT